MNNNTYPDADKISPFAGKLQNEADGWLANDYTFLPANLNDKYKHSKFGILLARSFPDAANYEQLTSFTRYLMWATILEDTTKHLSVEELRTAGSLALDILNGTAEHSFTTGIFRQVSLTKQQLLDTAPELWRLDFIKAFEAYYQEGLLVAQQYVKKNEVPALKRYLEFRPKALGSYPYLALTDIETDFCFSPKWIYHHPKINQLRQLSARLLAWENDLQAFEKGKNTPYGICNLVTVLAHHTHLGEEQAIASAIALREQDLRLFISLRQSLPDFGQYQNQVKKYLHYLGIMLSGVKTWYLNDTVRYK